MRLSMKMPEVLYKYMKKQHAKKMELFGTFQVCPLAYYQNTEKLGEQIGDDEEGVKKTNLHVDHYKNSDNNKEKDFVNNFFKAEDGANFELRNLTLSAPQIDNNYYVYCLSSLYSLDLMEEFKANAIVKIKQPFKFIKAMSENLSPWIVGNPEIVRCIYRNREFNYTQDNYINDGIPPYTLKPNRYSHQKEIRVVWKPVNVNGMEERIITSCPNIIEYCEFEYHDE